MSVIWANFNLSRFWLERAESDFEYIIIEIFNNALFAKVPNKLGLLTKRGGGGGVLGQDDIDVAPLIKAHWEDTLLGDDAAVSFSKIIFPAGLVLKSFPLVRHLDRMCVKSLVLC